MLVKCLRNVIFIVVTGLIVVSAILFPILQQGFSPISLWGYILLLVIFPSVVFWIVQRNKKIKARIWFGLAIWVLLVAIYVFFCITFLYDCIPLNKLVVYDSNQYLIQNTDFEQQITLVMPSKNSISKGEVVFYEHKKTRLKNGDNELLRISVLYPEDDFKNEIKRLEFLKQEKILKERQLFYLDGILYDGSGFSVNGNYYEFAFHTDSNSQTICYVIKQGNLDTSFSIADGFGNSFGHFRINSAYSNK